MRVDSGQPSADDAAHSLSPLILRSRARRGVSKDKDRISAPIENQSGLIISNKFSGRISK
jgi:hypothetical protein